MDTSNNLGKQESHENLMLITEYYTEHGMITSLLMTSLGRKSMDVRRVLSQAFDTTKISKTQILKYAIFVLYFFLFNLNNKIRKKVINFRLNYKNKLSIL